MKFNFLNNKLFKDSFIYIFTDIVNKAIPFVLLPILTFYLTPDDYGIIATFNSLVGMLGIFIGLSVQGAISVNYYKLNKENLAQYVGNIIYILLGSFFLTLVVLTLLKDIILIKIGLEYTWLIVAAVMSLASFIIIINLSLWLVEQKPNKYGGYEILESLLKFGLSIYFVVVLLMTWKGRIFGMLIASIISALISIFILNKRNYINMKWHRPYIKDALNFGIPLMPHQLSFWLRSGAIILLLAYLVGKKETGLYNVGTQFIIPIGVLTAAFNKAWAPYLYRKLTDSPTLQNKRKIVKFTYLYFIGVIILALLLSLIIPLVIDYLLEKSYGSASIYILYLALASAFQGMYLMVVNYIFYVKKTKYLAYITFIVSVINIILAYIFIVSNGSIGAVQAKVITSFINFLLVWYYSNISYEMPWNIFKKYD